MEDITDKVVGIGDKKGFKAYLESAVPGIYHGRTSPLAARLFKEVCWDYSAKFPGYVRPGGSASVPSDRYPVALYLMDHRDKGIFELRIYEHARPERVGFADGRKKDGRQRMRELRDSLSEMKDGDSFFWKCAASDIAYVRVTCSNMGASTRKAEGGLTISKNGTAPSDKDVIRSLCRNGGGKIPYGISVAYARSVISEHNGVSPEKMSVRVTTDGSYVEPKIRRSADGTPESEADSLMDAKLPRTLALVAGKTPWRMTQEDLTEVKTELQALLNWIKECMAKGIK